MTLSPQSVDDNTYKEKTMIYFLTIVISTLSAVIWVAAVDYSTLHSNYGLVIGIVWCIIILASIIGRIADDIRHNNGQGIKESLNAIAVMILGFGLMAIVSWICSHIVIIIRI